jgi:hypothetical protein
MSQERAYESDSIARGANHEQLVELLIDRAMLVTSLKGSDIIQEINLLNSAKQEVLWRLHRAKGPTPGI